MAKDRPHTQRSYPRLSQATASNHSPAPHPPLIRGAVSQPGKEKPSLTSLNPPEDNLLVEEVADQWLHLRWSISPKTLERADSVMGRDGHRAVRVLRISRVEQDESRLHCKELVEEIEIPPSAGEWFVRVSGKDYRWLIEIGMTFGKGRFFSMLHSPPVTLSGSRVSLQGTQRFLGTESLLESLERRDPPPLQVQGTFVLNGKTRPGTRTTIDDQVIPVDPETGEFEWRLPLTNGRVVVPINAVDRGRTRRALLALDLNFHLLEPEPCGEY